MDIAHQGLLQVISIVETVDFHVMYSFIGVFHEPVLRGLAHCDIPIVMMCSTAV